MVGIKKALAALVCVAVLALPAAAMAQSGVDGYSDNGSQVQNIVQGGGGNGGSGGGSGGSLPFTGSELGVLAAAGAALVLLGFGLRRVTHRPSQA
jgi:hypothetical protein